MTLSEAKVKHHEKLRQGLLAVNALVTVLFGGAALGWGPMQLMVSGSAGLAPAWGHPLLPRPFI